MRIATQGTCALCLSEALWALVTSDVSDDVMELGRLASNARLVRKSGSPARIVCELCAPREAMRTQVNREVGL